MHAMVFMHLVFGAFLIYTGVQTATADEEDEDPSQHPLVQWLQRQAPLLGRRGGRHVCLRRVLHVGWGWAVRSELGVVFCFPEHEGGERSAQEWSSGGLVLTAHPFLKRRTTRPPFGVRAAARCAACGPTTSAHTEHSCGTF